MILASALTYFVNRKGGLGQASLLSGVLLRSFRRSHDATTEDDKTADCRAPPPLPRAAGPGDIFFHQLFLFLHYRCSDLAPTHDRTASFSRQMNCLHHGKRKDPRKWRQNRMVNT
jgi:hypothetical protein